VTRASTASPPLPVLVFASGAAGLVYESLWLRSFGIVFGNTTDAVAVVLATFMGGLAVGSAWSARWRTASPLRAYARVEMGIAGAALLTLPLLRALPHVYASFEPLRGLSGPADVLARALAAALVLAPATVLLGATVPLAVEALARRGRDAHGSLGRLYLVNTLGGAVGVAAGPFLLLPALGVTGTFGAAALVNLLVGAFAWRASQDAESAPPAVERSDATPASPPLFAGLAAASGAFTFAIEVIWTRSLALVVGSSVYAFASMLLAVLLGIAAGTIVYERMRPRILRPALALGLLFGACGLLTLLSAIVLGRLPGAFFFLMKALPTSFAAHTLAGLALSLVALLPVTIILGVTFPLVFHLAAPGGALGRTGRLYAWNTAGAVAGALLADFVLVRALGLEASYLLLAGLVLAAGAAATLHAKGWGIPASAGAAVAVVVLAALTAPRFRPWDRIAMTAGVYLYGLEWKERPAFELEELGRERQLLFYEEGREAVVAVSGREGSSRRFLSVNGKTDAGNGAEDVLTQKFIAHVPLLLHPAPRQALVVGWGAGATAAAAALYPLERLECVEIEAATYRAAPLFADLSGRVREDPRFRIVFRDGRTHLLRTRERFDVIVSEPSNPWITGVANLFTREFYETVRARLAPGGVFGQWFHYYRLEPGDVKTELATFAAVFPHVSLWLVPPVTRDGGPGLAADMLLVGSREPLSIDRGRLGAAFRGAPGEDLRATGVVEDEAALVASWTMDGEALRRFVGERSGPLNSDDYPAIELLAPRRNVMPPAEVARQARALYDAMVAGATDPPLTGPDSGDTGAFRLALARRYAATAQPARALRALESAVAADPSLDAAFDLLGQLHIDRQDFAAAERAHRELLRLKPGNVEGWLRLSAVLARQSKWKDAHAAIRRAREIDPAAPVDPALLQFLEQQAGG
jgi:spermidine synthase